MISVGHFFPPVFIPAQRMSNQMPSSYLGKILLRWCDQCHTPVLAEQCSCGSATRAVPVTPPGDARPAFPADIALINSIFLDHFGMSVVSEGQIVLLNKVPDNDRMDEVIVGGGVIGSIRYIPKKRCWEPVPRPEACVLAIPKKRFVVVDDSAVPFIHDQGMSVLAPGLVSIDDAVQAGDEVFIMTEAGTCIGVGRAKVDAATARLMERGSIVRTRRNIASQVVPGPATWKEAVRANSAVINRAETAAVTFVSEVAAAYPLPATISYSGGKDSLATLLVVTKALGKVPLLFADTGLEFPETYENITTASQKYGLSVIRTNGSNKFWETFTREGPPAVNSRWCCSVCKLAPIAALVQSQWGECLSFIGQRKYESLSRAQSKRVWRNPKIKVQLSAAPIQNWTALHVWLYLFQEEAPYNRLYEHRLDRIGCFMCPSSDMALIHMIEADYPELWKMWQDKIVSWQDENGLPADWVVSGRWRVKEGFHGKEGRNN
jgi:phosphoadenosine phosphosulfate reductase